MKKAFQTTLLLPINLKEKENTQPDYTVKLLPINLKKESIRTTPSLGFDQTVRLEIPIIGLSPGLRPMGRPLSLWMVQWQDWCGRSLFMTVSKGTDCAEGCIISGFRFPGKWRKWRKLNWWRRIFHPVSGQNSSSKWTDLIQLLSSRCIPKLNPWRTILDLSAA